MRVTQVRNFIGAVFAVILMIALVIGVLAAFGKPVPLIGRFLGL